MRVISSGKLTSLNNCDIYCDKKNQCVFTSVWVTPVCTISFITFTPKCCIGDSKADPDCCAAFHLL